MNSRKRPISAGQHPAEWSWSAGGCVLRHTVLPNADTGRWGGGLEEHWELE
jgi:hypothetical protein